MTRSSLMIVVFGLAALLVASCARSTPTPTSDVQSGAGTPVQVETPSVTPTATAEAGSGAGTLVQVETPSVTPTAAAETGSGAGALTQLETPLANPRTTPTPARAPIVGQSQPVLDHQARDEQRLREVMEEFPQGMKTWIDQDTIVYLLIRDPHDREGELVAVGLDLPTGAVKNYERPTRLDKIKNLHLEDQARTLTTGAIERVLIADCFGVTSVWRSDIPFESTRVMVQPALPPSRQVSLVCRRKKR